MFSVDRDKIARVRNSVEVLLNQSNGGHTGCISPESIMSVYRRSEELSLSVKDMLRPNIFSELI